jgi:large subunit ribosomal protein L10
MAKTKEKKIEFVKNLEDWLKRAKSLVLINYYGLKVKEINELRKILKQAECKYVVVKKTLLKHTLEKLGLKNINIDKITGGVGLILGMADEIVPAKLAINFNKEHEKMQIHGGIFNNELIGPEQVQELSKLPTKEQLKAKLVWLIKSPLQNMINVLHGNLRSLIYILSQIKNK